MLCDDLKFVYLILTQLFLKLVWKVVKQSVLRRTSSSLSQFQRSNVFFKRSLQTKMVYFWRLRKVTIRTQMEIKRCLHNWQRVLFEVLVNIKTKIKMENDLHFLLKTWLMNNVAERRKSFLNTWFRFFIFIYMHQ